MEKTDTAMNRQYVAVRIQGRYGRPYRGSHTAHAGSPLSCSLSSRSSLCRQPERLPHAAKKRITAPLSMQHTADQPEMVAKCILLLFQKYLILCKDNSWVSKS